MDESYRTPEIVDKKTGLFVSEAQVNLFLNGPNALTHIENNDPEWQEYSKQCQIWNLMYDSTVNDNANSCGFMYWDEFNECLAIHINIDGPVDIFLREKKLL